MFRIVASALIGKGVISASIITCLAIHLNYHHHLLLVTKTILHTDMKLMIVSAYFEFVSDRMDITF